METAQTKQNPAVYYSEILKKKIALVATFLCLSTVLPPYPVSVASLGVAHHRSVHQPCKFLFKDIYLPLFWVSKYYSLTPPIPTTSAANTQDQRHQPPSQHRLSSRLLGFVFASFALSDQIFLWYWVFGCFVFGLSLWVDLSHTGFGLGSFFGISTKFWAYLFVFLFSFWITIFPVPIFSQFTKKKDREKQIIYKDFPSKRD